MTPDESRHIIEATASKTGLKTSSVAAVIELLDQGATVPFIARYRKERTGGLDEVAIRDIQAARKTVTELFDRKNFVIEAIREAGGLTEELESKISQADNMTAIEDIYAPFKPKKRTRATLAREKGLEPLAKIIMAGKDRNCLLSAERFASKAGMTEPQEALNGACDIIAEWASDSTRLRNITRNTYRRASLSASPAKGKEKEISWSTYSNYADFSQTVRRISSHQYLALRRAEREGLLKVKYALEDPDGLDSSLIRAFSPSGASPSCRELISLSVKDAAKRLLRPSVENEMSASLKEEADRVAIDIFSNNLRQLLLAPPLKGFSVLAIDPGYRTGCKVVALDSQGNLLEDAVIYPVPPRNDFDGAQKILERLVRKHNLQAAAIGNGTASHETEHFVKGTKLFPDERIYIVNENGASVYSASDIARKEFPDKDVTVRGAVSIGRRLIDSLSELVKIEPKAIGVGQYQHDVDQAKLKDSLDYTVMSCVNAVGVDVNTASEKLLSYISGIGPSLAANIVAYRTKNGDFKTREELRNVPRLGDKAFEQCAGFLRVPGGGEPLDNTGIHPESYRLVEKIAKSQKMSVTDLIGNREALSRISPEELAAAGLGGEDTIRDILTELAKPGRDPRTDNDSDSFVPAVESFEDLKPGMMVEGIVNNITAFGAFVNIGIKENALIHISQLSRRRVSAVSDILKLGQKVEALVIDIDTSRRRIALSMIQ